MLKLCPTGAVVEVPEEQQYTLPRINNRSVFKVAISRNKLRSWINRWRTRPELGWSPFFLDYLRSKKRIDCEPD
jgi:hypothetical protein